MPYDIEAIFDDAVSMTKIKRKPEYANCTDQFKQGNWQAFLPVIEAAKANPTEAFAIFLEDIVACLGGKRGKLKGNDIMTLNYFFVYYIFPTILTEYPEDGEILCDALRDAYNSRLKQTINYTTYDNLYSGFVTKIFGISIGKEQ